MKSLPAIPMPPAIQALPRWGMYPIPWFVTVYVDGRPDFRVVESSRVEEALVYKLCWICGQPLRRRQLCFAIGPMCTVNRVSAEPPQHGECAAYAARICPFMMDPARGRRSGGLADTVAPDAGMITRNPGVTALWFCSSFTPEEGDGRLLFRLGEPDQVRWMREGREATRDEVAESFASGCPALQRLAEEEGPRAVAELERLRGAAVRFWPRAGRGGQLAAEVRS